MRRQQRRFQDREERLPAGANRNARHENSTRQPLVVGSKPTLVGIDHAFSFPQAYFDRHNLQPNWHLFLDDFCAHWPTDEEKTYVDFVRKGACGNGAARTGDSHWRRGIEIQTRAKSAFHFDIQGSVAKSTHAGLPWLRYIRDSLGKTVHFWPFDGWVIPTGMHVIAEVYPSLWRARYPVTGLTADQQDAYTVCRWMQEADQAQILDAFLTPSLTPAQIEIAKIEGWILGIKCDGKE